MSIELNNKLENIRMSILSKFPTLGYILQHYNIIPLVDTKTAATDGINIYVNYEFFNGLSINDSIFVILLELFHILLKHPSRSRGKNKHIYNIACDIVVNDNLTHYGFKFSDPKRIVLGRNIRSVYINSFNETAEQIYDKLIKSINSHKFKFISSHELLNNIDYEKVNNKTKYVLSKISTKDLSNLDILLFNRLNIKICKYNDNIPKFLEKQLTLKLFDYDFMKTDKRYVDILIPDYSPIINSVENIWFVVDVSGSMGKETLNKVFSEIINTINRYEKFHCKLSFFSTVVTVPKDINNTEQLHKSLSEIKSTYGTSFKVIFESLTSYFPYSLPKAIVILTDGLSQFPNQDLSLGIPVLWVISNNLKISPSFGEACYI